jgi:hypothetical protein
MPGRARTGFQACPIRRAGKPGQTQGLALEASQTAKLGCLHDGVTQMFKIEGLGQVAEDAKLDGFGGAFPGRQPSDKQNGQIGIMLAHRTQKLDAVHTWHVDVADHGIEAALTKERQCIHGRMTGDDVELLLQRALKQGQHHGFVVHHQHARWQVRVFRVFLCCYANFHRSTFYPSSGRPPVEGA